MRVFITIIFTLFFSFENLAACIPNGGQLTPVLVDSVSVDALGNVIICWQASSDADIAKYYIFHKNPLTGSNDVIDSVGSATTCYTILAANNNSSTTPEEYAIGVRDLCDNSNFVNLDYHNTVFLDKTVDICSASIILSWNAYDDFQSGLNVSYNVYASENGGPYILVGTSNQLTLTFSGVQQGSVYDIYVQAVENGGVGPFSSSSNYINVNTSFFLTDPNFLYLYTATVTDSLNIDLLFYVDTAADIREYEILRANSIAGPFSKVGTISDVNGMNPLVSYNDYGVKANQQSYVYKVNSINLCGDLKITSNIGKTILTSAISNKLEAFNTITFSNYQGWLGGVNNYEIYRAVAGFWESSPIATLPAFNGSVSYTDNISDMLIGNGEFCYKVIATENPVVHVGNLPEASSTSNDACVLHEPILYIPNAFDPLSDYNPIFIPILTYAEPATYIFSIYDRWGHKLFETNDVYEGWDGDNQPVGPYVYSIYFQSNEGEEFHKRGTVALLR